MFLVEGVDDQSRFNNVMRCLEQFKTLVFIGFRKRLGQKAPQRVLSPARLAFIPVIMFYCHSDPVSSDRLR